MRTAIAAAVLLAFGAQAASAQTTSFRGFRVEGNVGWDKAQSEGSNNEKLGYGGSAGFDGQIGDRIVVGPEVTYWHPDDGRNVVATSTAAGGSLYHRQGDAWSGDVRVGYLATPSLLVFGKGGYVNQAQGRAFVSPAGVVTGDRGHADGYQVGGGVEYTLHDRFSFAPTGVYVSAQYVYSNFDNHTSDQHAMAGVGLRFR